jgi:23S rRNA C2498 (ribose-2'-O)-methylase RlmM
MYSNFKRFFISNLNSALTTNTTTNNLRKLILSSILLTITTTYYYYGISNNNNNILYCTINRNYFEFTTDNKKKILEQRQHAEQKLKELANITRKQRIELENQHEQNKLSNAEYELKLRVLKNNSVKQANMIIYGNEMPSELRESWLQENGCVKISSTAIQEIKKLKMKIVELGAGNGKWTEQLQNAGVDIVAYDTFQLLPTNSSKPSPLVKFGNETVLDQYNNTPAAEGNYALLLVYPPPELAMKALQRFKGNVIIYVGEPRGGVNAPTYFFDILEKDWILIKKVTDFERLPNSEENMWIVKRN